MNNRTTRKTVAAVLLSQCALTSQQVVAADYLLSTPKTSLVITAETGKRPLLQYYGARIEGAELQGLLSSGFGVAAESYPAFGLNSITERAVAVRQSNGDLSLDLAIEAVEQKQDNDGEVLEIRMKDNIYPVSVSQFFKAYAGTDIISTWVVITNADKKKAVTLTRFDSAFLTFHRGENWLTHFHGNWGAETTMDEERLTNGQKVIDNRDGLVNTETDNPSVMLTLNGRPEENHGNVFGGVLAWTSNYVFKADCRNDRLILMAGINPAHSEYTLDAGSSFETPEFCMTFSTTGKGGVSRAFHCWARRYKLHDGNRLHDILLNSWEGVYFKVNQEGMDAMMQAFGDLGGELFVMDDGWFGNKYPRNNGSTSLGDWEVCHEKLPGGIQGLIDSAKKNGIKFGIWIEPEMANTKSELFERHPEWVLQVKDRELSTGRGGTQIVLDLTNPAVQDHVFNVVDRLMTENPEIYYMKWDDNSPLRDYGSLYLPKDRQSHLYIDYQRGLYSVLQRIRAKYPKLIIQACAGGGGRINYGLLPYFDEFWTSDDTDALQRIYLQWGVSHFYPAVGMASHVSANRNHQTGRVTPLKFRFDVAMSGRLGMEIQPKDMNDADREFARRAIAAYKEIRPTVQLGDLYRLVSPYEHKGVASVMYIRSDDSHQWDGAPRTDVSAPAAVLFVWKIQHFINELLPVVQLEGLDPAKNYRLRDLTPAEADKPCPLNGQVLSGRFLMESGLDLRQTLKSEYSSVCLALEEE